MAPMTAPKTPPTIGPVRSGGGGGVGGEGGGDASFFLRSCRRCSRLCSVWDEGLSRYGRRAVVRGYKHTYGSTAEWSNSSDWVQLEHSLGGWAMETANGELAAQVEAQFGFDVDDPRVAVPARSSTAATARA